MNTNQLEAMLLQGIITDDLNLQTYKEKKKFRIIYIIQIIIQI